ncbi:MAG: TonB-dependent receptor [Ignavibacteriae bacterium]|nr:TonB-dependent receptor [Ignavibacteriota bacterium]MCB9214505.1 TonB-dependent receptor [Ignavibacteria bacterium]
MRRFLSLFLVPLTPFLILIAIPSSSLLSQPGSLEGTVLDGATRDPLPGATVQVISVQESGSLRGGVTRGDGTYLIKGLPAGRYRATISSIGYGTVSDTLVEIRAGGRTTLNVELVQEGLTTDGVVITASRRPEKVTAAPASTTVIRAQEVEETTAISPIDHVRGVKGLDVVQGGLAQNTVVARGFNNIFSGNLTSLTDNRFASVPSLRYNGYYFIPLVNEDIEQIEIVRGPGSALYGPNASNGVMHIITRSPLSSSGTSVSVAGGERDLFQGMFRHAGTVGDRFGYKISGQYMRGEDWGYTDTAEVSARRQAIADSLLINPSFDTSSVLIGRRDSTMERFGGEGRIDWLLTDDATLILSTGMTMALNNTDATGVGSAQAQDWQYWYHQARFRWRDLFVQAFLNRSNAGETYLLRTGQPIVDRSTVFVTQAQHAASIGEKERLTYGLDFIVTNPVTDSTVTGRNENDDNFNEIGAYVQSETDLITDQLNLVAALRLDKHSRLNDPVLSPRAALVWTPQELGAFRLTYNRAYNAPTTNEMFLDIVGQNVRVDSGFSFNVRGSGVPQEGYSFRFDSEGDPMMRSFLAEDPSVYLETDNIAAIWKSIQTIAKNLLPNPALGSIVDAIPAPPQGTVKTELRALNLSTGAFDSFEGKRVTGREQVLPTINNTIEFGWQGILFNRVGISVDLYRSHYNNFVGPLETITPTVFFNAESLTSYLVDVFVENGVSEEQAQIFAALFVPQLAGVAGSKENPGLPLGTISPVEAADLTAVLLTYRNYGNITLYGYDVGILVDVVDGLTLSGNLSYVDNNFFPNLDSIADLSLNAPKFKFNLGGDWRNNSLGLNAGVLFRHVDGFPVRSGVYSGEVPGYSTLSLDIGYKLPWIEGMTFFLSAQNLMTWVEGSDESPFELRHAEFVGTPEIGRLVLGRIAYEF